MTVDVEDRGEAVDDRRAITVQRLGTAATDAAERRRWRRRAMAAVVVVLVAVGLLAWQAPKPAEEPTGAAFAAETRDQVVVAASEAVEVLNTLDHRDVEGGVDAWENVTTGALHEELVAIGAEEAAALADAGAVSSARVVEAAVLDLDVDAGTAHVIAFTEVTVTPRSGPDAVNRHRYVVDLRRVDGRWLVEAMATMELEQ